MMISLVFRFNRSFALRLAHTIVLVGEEYDRAMLATSSYYSLKGRDLTGQRQPRAGSRDIPRTIFEAFYIR